MLRLQTSFVLGYHGCDAAVAERLLDGEPFKPSTNDYDWLGPGIYFWEANPLRGLDFAREVAKRRHRSVESATVIGAVIELGRCLDLASKDAIDMVAAGYESLDATMKATRVPLPKNGTSLLLRRLDCAVINRVHAILEEQGVVLDTVRGTFVEGEPVYATAGFNTKTHTQIAVCNPACIKGVFRVPAGHLRTTRPA